MTDYLMNTWYMGGWGHEITDQPISRRLLGVNTMFYRKTDGSVVALRDRCPHRFAPLSKGKIINDQVQCPYDGLVFDSTGQCVANPITSDTRIPEAVRVQRFPVLEQANIVWFWPGDPARCDSALIPQFPYLADVENYKHVYGLTPVKAHFEIETDNLMDLSHVDMLHPAFAGAFNKSSKYTAGRNGNTVFSHWHTTNTRNTAFLEYGPFPTHGAPVDQWLEMYWQPPGAMFLEVIVTKTGEPRSAGYSTKNVHILTPETEHSTNYFWSGALNSEDQVPLEVFREGFNNAFEFEDKPMIEAVAAEMGEETNLLAMKPLLLRSDGGSVLARRVLAELIARERSEDAGSAVAAE
ncbi:Rieske 2Fe-2S domain-containing protein [Lichenicoccus sp.]|uniref:Rieske 2Fe-2S domain-containing protein n=1 Tax=Lichenicoccus sp. TaxID=2781899 RepID=UPI003D0B623C